MLDGRVYTLVGAAGAKALEEEWAKLLVDELVVGTLGPAKTYGNG